MQHFRLSFLVTVLGLATAGIWGWTFGFEGHHGWLGALNALVITVCLGILELSLSFDNAFVNATVLQDMDAAWKHRFLTWGMLVAVFGMRLVFPILIVVVTAGLGVGQVIALAFREPATYAHHLHAAQPSISAFGGMFLLLVFLDFLFDDGRKRHWLGRAEAILGKIGRLESASIILSLAVLLIGHKALPVALQIPVLVAGISGILLYTLVDGLANLLAIEEDGVLKRIGLSAFLYLELLDASFSFDGVIGAFALSREVVIITIGLAIGAMFVRSLTLFLVEKGTLQEYVFLEHGAHYAIGSLAVLMLVDILPSLEIPEYVTALIGVTFILLSLASSIAYRKQHPSVG